MHFFFKEVSDKPKPKPKPKPTKQLVVELLGGASGRLVYFVPYLHGGRSLPYNYNTKYTSPRRCTPQNFDNKLLDWLWLWLWLGLGLVTDFFDKKVSNKSVSHVFGRAWAVPEVPSGYPNAPILIGR